ncbi:hypothetical protein D3C78_1787950 [compost metagenome]
MGGHRRLQHAQARALLLTLDQEPRTQGAHAAFAGFNDKRPGIAVTGFDQDFAFLQDDQSLLLIETHVHRTVGVEVDQGAIIQANGA